MPEGEAITPYAADEAALRMRDQRIPFFLAPLMPLFPAYSMFSSGTFSIGSIIALTAITASVICFMRLLWMGAHYQDYQRGKEYRVLKGIAYAAVPVSIIALILTFII